VYASARTLVASYGRLAGDDEAAALAARLRSQMSRASWLCTSRSSMQNGGGGGQRQRQRQRQRLPPADRAALALGAGAAVCAAGRGEARRLLPLRLLLLVHALQALRQCCAPPGVHATMIDCAGAALCCSLFVCRNLGVVTRTWWWQSGACAAPQVVAPRGHAEDLGVLLAIIATAGGMLLRWRVGRTGMDFVFQAA
jgi:hypothetical protein